VKIITVKEPKYFPGKNRTSPNKIEEERSKTTNGYYTWAQKMRENIKEMPD
jgi:hypothetical protein